MRSPEPNQGVVSAAQPIFKINSLCAAFEVELERRGRSEWDSYLSQVENGSRESLFRNMLQIVLRMRRGAGETPSEAEFIERFPHFSHVVREEFQISTVIAESMAVETRTFRAKSVEPTLPSVTRLGSYALDGILGRGGMGAVFAAIHVTHGTRVALKTLPNVSGRELQLFKREFRALADVNHPNLVGLHSLQEDAGQWFFTMDLVDGEEFLSHVRPGESLDERRLRDALAQLALGVQALHAKNIVHRDLKPTNVMVDREGRVLLLDFGVVLDLTTPGEENETAGTPAFMAPEQFSGNTTTASDWYAVGVMIYNALSGKLPFTGSLTEIFREKQSQDPPLLPENLPADLVELSRRLLARDPADRPDTGEILRLLAAEDDVEAVPAVAVADHITGREAQLDQLGEIVDAFIDGETARTLFISGRSGEGKTLLAEHFLRQFRDHDRYTVLVGRCYDRESVPFKAVDSLIDALTTYLRSHDDAEVRRSLTPDVAILAELFPVLDRVPEIAKLPRVSLDDVELDRVRRFAAAGLRAILQGLSRRATLILFIDDLQWGDADSADLLLNVLRPPESPKVLFLGTYRSDEAEKSRFLKEWDNEKTRSDQNPPHHDCELAPLGDEECIRLVLEIVGVDDDAMRHRAKEMARETGGNPFLLTELASCINPAGEAVQPMHVDEVVERKLTQLPAEARALLAVVSVSGQALAIDEATKTAGHEAVPLSTITRMRTERLLRLVGDESAMTVDTYHDRIRETVLRELDDGERHRLHVQLAEQILAKSPDASSNGDEAPTNPRVYDLAYHFYEGGDGRAFNYQLQAGEAAVRVFAVEDGYRHLKRAAEVLPDDSSDSVRFRLWERLGDVCNRSERIPEGLDAFQSAKNYASTQQERGLVYNGIGEMQHRDGDFDAAIENWDLALRELGYPRSNWLPRILIEIPWFLTWTTLTWFVRPHRDPTARSRAELAVKVLQRMTFVYILNGDLARYTSISIRSGYVALRSGSFSAMSVGYSKLGYNNATVSLRFLSRWMLKRSQNCAQRSCNGLTQSLSNFHVGAAKYCLGELDESESHLRSSLEILERGADSYFRMCAHHFLRHIYSLRGVFNLTVQHAQIEVNVGESLSEPDTICWGHYGMADGLARIGCVEEAQQHIRRSLNAIKGLGHHLSETIALNHAGFVYLQSSDYAEAIRVLEESCKILEKRLAYLEYTVYTYPRLVESIVGPDWLKLRRGPDIRRARRHARRAWFFGWRFPTIRTHSLRARGRLFAVTGRMRKARRCFEKAVREGRRIGTTYEEARALLDLSAVDEERQQELRDEAVSTLKRLEAVIPYAERWQLGDDPDMACVAPEWKPEPQS